MLAPFHGGERVNRRQPCTSNGGSDELSHFSFSAKIPA